MVDDRPRAPATAIEDSGRATQSGLEVDLPPLTFGPRLSHLTDGGHERFEPNAVANCDPMASASPAVTWNTKSTVAISVWILAVGYSAWKPMRLRGGLGGL